MKMKDMKDKTPAFHVLIEVTKLLNRLKIPYSLDGGTLLGFYREGWFFDHDSDIDITLLDKNPELDIIKDKVKKLGFYVALFKKIGSSGSKKLGIKKSKIYVDIISKVEKDGYALWSIRKDPKPIKRVPVKFYKKLGTLEIRGHKFSVPEDTEGYLETRYGKTWRTPIIDWDRKKGDLAYKI